MSTSILWLFCGLLFGAIITLAIIAICIRIEENQVDEEKFVKQLVEKVGWEKANVILTFEFEGKYLKTWRKMYIKYIEEGGDKK